MKISARVKLDVDPIAAGDVVVQLLKRDHALLVKDCEEFLRHDKFTRLQVGDYNNNLATAKAMEAVMEYYMEGWEYTIFLEENGIQARMREIEID